MGTRLSEDDFSTILPSGELQIAGFGPYTVHLYFESYILVVHARVQVRTKEGLVSVWNAETDLNRGDTRMFTRLVGATVESYKVDTEEKPPALVLVLNSGAHIRLLDDGTESFTFNFPDGSFIAV